MDIDPGWARAVVAGATLALLAIRAPHVKRSLRIEVVESLEGGLEKALVACVLLALLLSIVWVASPLLAFADYPMRPGPFVAGTLALLAGLWLLHRSHADLGGSWSNTLELRRDHRLVTGGVYRRLRHPMYTALLLYSAGQALVLPNWLAGPACLFAFGLLVALRLRAEERMMLHAFGRDWESYAARTKRLLPGIW